MTPAARLALAGAGLALALQPSSPQAATIDLSREGLSLLYDDQVWKERASVGPLPVVLDCDAPDCRGRLAIFVHLDGRPFLTPGAGRFPPGAIGPAGLLDLRAQSIVPGAKARPAAPLEPAAIGAAGGYRARYAVEDRNLETRGMILLAMPAGGDLVLAALVGADATRSDVARFEAVAATIRKAPRGPP
jgi:hypothetical protein